MNRLETIRDLHGRGYTLAAIGEEVGVSRQRVSAILRGAGVTENPRRDAGEARAALVLRLRDEGHTLSGIAATTGLDRSTVWRMLKRLRPSAVGEQK